jgi:hypothetical protein
MCKPNFISYAKRAVIKGQLWSGFGGMGDRFDPLIPPARLAIYAEVW